MNSKYEYTWAQRDAERRERFEKLSSAYDVHQVREAGDFSERLLRQVDRIASRYHEAFESVTGGELTERLFQSEIPALDHAVAAYLETKDEVWLLMDNLDKSWPTRGASKEDILILRTLLEATRKLKRQLERRDTAFQVLVFIRNDIYEHLILESSDKGKDTAIILDYDDPELFKQIISERIKLSTGLPGTFDDIWPAVFDTHVGTRDAFEYILDRTLMRPRDLLNFLHRAIEIAINRGHDRVRQDDILRAEAVYSEDILLSVAFELGDVCKNIEEPLYAFLRCGSHMLKEEVFTTLLKAGCPQKQLDDVVRLLVWFGFFGIQENERDHVRFAYQARHNIDKVMAPLRHVDAYFVVHPAFRKALECVELA